MEQDKKPMVADILAKLLDESGAWIHVGSNNFPSVYVNDGEKRYCVRKVQLFDKDTGKLTSQWVNLGEAKKKISANQVDPALVAAIAEKLGDA